MSKGFKFLVGYFIVTCIASLIVTAMYLCKMNGHGWGLFK